MSEARGQRSVKFAVNQLLPLPREGGSRSETEGFSAEPQLFYRFDLNDRGNPSVSAYLATSPWQGRSFMWCANDVSMTILIHRFAGRGVRTNQLLPLPREGGSRSETEGFSAEPQLFYRFDLNDRGNPSVSADRATSPWQHILLHIFVCSNLRWPDPLKTFFMLFSNPEERAPLALCRKPHRPSRAGDRLFTLM